MLHSFLRNTSPYTRFLLQEERKQKNVFGSMIHMLGYRNLLFFETLHYDRLIIPLIRQILSKQNIPNLLLQLIEITYKTENILKNQDEVRQNKITTIQYEANNGIEDRIVGCKLKSINGQILCIFDGHGGDKLSNYCAENIVQLIDTNLQQHFKNKSEVGNLDEIIVNALKYAYNKIQNDFYYNVYTELVALGDRKIKNVGTCALTAIMYNNKVYVANCGDSQAILVSKNSNQQISYTQLNERLSVNNPIQRQRMMKQFPNDRDIVVQEQSGSFYVKGRLQPTRTLGDYHLKYKQLFKGKGKFNGPYIQSQPDIRIFPINKQHKCIVMASDGVWDYVNKETVAKASLKYNPHEQILQQTLNKIADAHDKSISQVMKISAQQKRAYHDDISVAILILGNCNKSNKL